MNHLVKVYAYAEMFPAGQKTNAAIIEYDVPVESSSVDISTFAVEGRVVIDAAVNDHASLKGRKKTGRFVILSLSTHGKEGDVIVEGERRQPGPPPPKMRVAPSVHILQRKPILAADGTKVEPDKSWIDSTDSIEPVVDRFLILEYEGLKYNLFVPDGQKDGKRYPLVLFIADIGANGLADRMALSQGIGGTVWASEMEQKKHPCFVLVPQFPFMQVMRDDFTFDPIFLKVKPLLDEVCKTHPVDTDRLYVTGQSQGCMAACELNCEYPDLFAASMLVAGQWDEKRMAEHCVGQRYWILTSEADEKATDGMNAVVDAMAEQGSTVARSALDAKAPLEELEKQISIMRAEDAEIRMTVFSGDSVIPDWDDGPSRRHHAHSHTWPIAYQLEGVRDWLFSCHK